MSAAAGTNARTPPRRWPRAGRGQKHLLGASLMVVLGSFLPWLLTGVGSFSGARGAGLWTFYAACLGVAGALVPSRRAAAVQAALLAVVAIALPAWQVIHVVGLVGFAGWAPGPGLVLVAGGGVLAGVAAVRLRRGTD